MRKGTLSHDGGKYLRESKKEEGGRGGAKWVSGGMSKCGVRRGRESSGGKEVSKKGGE